MRLSHVSGAISTDAGRGVPSPEEIEAAALVLSVVDLPATKLRTLAQMIVRHTRQAVSEAEKRADDLERLLTNAIEKLDEFDVQPCSSCHALVSRNAERTVDAAGFYCSLDCGVTAGALCWQCSKPTDGEEDGLCSEECARKAAAEDRANA